MTGREWPWQVKGTALAESKGSQYRVGTLDYLCSELGSCTSLERGHFD